MEGYDNAAYLNLIVRPNVFMIKELVLSNESCSHPFAEILHVALLKHIKESGAQYRRLRASCGCGLIVTREHVFVSYPLPPKVRCLEIITSVNFYKPNKTRVFVR